MTTEPGGTQPALILTAHGSADPRSSAVAHALAGRMRRLRPRLDVRVAFLERTDPGLSEVLADVAERRAHAVVVPMLLASGYHAGVDIPSAIEASGASVQQSDVLGEDPALINLLRMRLAEAGLSPDDPELGVIVAAVGSSRDTANDRTASVGDALRTGTRWAGVEVAFATGPHPTLGEATEHLVARGASRLVVAPWFLAPGRITDRLAKQAGELGIPMIQPLGSHNLVAATLLDRFDAILDARLAA